MPAAPAKRRVRESRSVGGPLLAPASLEALCLSAYSARGMVEIEGAYQRMLMSDVEYRFVIDMATLDMATS